MAELKPDWILPARQYDFAEAPPLTEEQREALRRMIEAMRSQPLQVLPKTVILTTQIHQLANLVLQGEEDAVWPLIDEIMTTRTPPTNLPGLPTYHELLEALRQRNEVILDLMALGDKPRIRDELNNDFVVQELVKRCEGVKT